MPRSKSTTRKPSEHATKWNLYMKKWYPKMKEKYPNKSHKQLLEQSVKILKIS